MRSAWTFAHDGLGCSQRVPWGEFPYGRLATGLRHSTFPEVRRGLPQVQNDRGARQIHVRTRALVCAGQAPPNDHPHVSLRIAKESYVICPYCGTKIVYHAERI